MKKNSTADIIRFAESFGIKVELGNSPNSYNFIPLKNGKYKAVMYVGITTKLVIEDKKILNEIIENNISHELGHFLAASSKRKYKKDFGIPKEKRAKSGFWGDGKYWDEDDVKANFIGNEILLHFKSKWAEPYKKFVTREFGLDRPKNTEKNRGTLWGERTYLKLDRWWKEEGKKSLHHIFRMYHYQEKLAAEENPVLGKMASRNWKV